jgi:hypothetical protein
MLVSSKDVGLQVNTEKPSGLCVHVLQTERRKKSQIKDGQQTPWKCGYFQAFVNDNVK